MHYDYTLTISKKIASSRRRCKLRSNPGKTINQPAANKKIKNLNQN